VADETPDSPAGWTLGDIRKWGMTLEAVCKTEGCGEFAVFNLEGLIARLGADHPLPEAPPAALRCETCGGEMKFQLAVWHDDDKKIDE
jgi:hypothetical protein